MRRHQNPGSYEAPSWVVKVQLSVHAICLREVRWGGVRRQAIEGSSMHGECMRTLGADDDKRRCAVADGNSTFSEKQRAQRARRRGISEPDAAGLCGMLSSSGSWKGLAEELGFRALPPQTLLVRHETNVAQNWVPEALPQSPSVATKKNSPDHPWQYGVGTCNWQREGQELATGAQSNSGSVMIQAQQVVGVSIGAEAVYLYGDGPYIPPPYLHPSVLEVATFP
eukprot:365309-Chlamydomonas_euryale.AAC.17